MRLSWAESQLSVLRGGTDSLKVGSQVWNDRLRSRVFLRLVGAMEDLKEGRNVIWVKSLIGFL